MCGIIGYVGNREAMPILLEGLKNLEYRGYDSAGICILNENGLQIVKNKGKVAELEKDKRIDLMEGTRGIAHTRWATHGEPNEINAHPHANSNSTIAIVHNGIIENYRSLRKLLEKEGCKFMSETDSEVLAHLINKFYKNGNLEKAVLETLRLVEGTWGLAVVCKDKKEIIAARKGSPLVIGLGDNEAFLASDSSPLVKYTKRVIYLKDNEIAIIGDKELHIKDFTGKNVDFEIEHLKFEIEQIEKGNFKHFMLKEIFEQPESVQRTLSGRLKGFRTKLSLKIDKPEEVNRLIILGCGTSWHSALIGKYLIEKIAKIPVEVDYASEFRYRNPIIKKSDLVVAISQSGETADTLAAIKEAKSLGANTLGIVNVVGSSIARECASGIYLHAGPEIGVASTKAFTSQTTALLLLALYFAEKRGEKIEENLLNEIVNLPKKIKEVLEEAGTIAKIAKKYHQSSNFLFLGRGINYPVALEGALKLKEISYIHAEGYPAAEMKHGPIALVDENMPTIFICTKDSTYDKVISNMQEVKARKGKIIALINEVDAKVSALADDFIFSPKITELLSPIVNSIPLQLFAYHIADLKGLDVDKPRNLAKSVTVE
jgi:glutamine---fructose-6-phosphate transaminase (isomerizing)